jgi:predicted amidohydrolase
MEKLIAACVQYTASTDWQRDVDTALYWLDIAVVHGATLALLPEVCAGVGTRGGLPAPVAFAEDEHPALKALSAFARERGVEVIAGSIGILSDDDRILNSSFMIGADGAIRSRYDKIHLCDIDLPDRQIRESATVSPGTGPVLSSCALGKLGMSICYDLRFPHLYRHYAQQGATVISVPSAFMRHTGEAHWHTLLRARAIETGCFVLAAGQCGRFENGVELYGHSLIVDPWGRVLAEAADEPGVITAELDVRLVQEARGKVPAWSLQPGETPGFKPSPAIGERAVPQ